MYVRTYVRTCVHEPDPVSIWQFASFHYLIVQIIDLVLKHASVNMDETALSCACVCGEQGTEALKEVVCTHTYTIAILCACEYVLSL